MANPTGSTEASGPPSTHPPPSVETDTQALTPKGIWERIKDHKVAQWTLAYAAAAYTLLHGAEMLSDAQEWPHIFVRVLSLVLVLGVPVVITLAWYHGAKSLRRVSGPELTIITILLVIAGSILWALTRANGEHPARTTVAVPSATTSTTTSAAAPRTSVAVVPFANLTGDPGKEYFSDGMAEEMIDALARVPNLKVPARTSSFAYKGRKIDIRQIGKDLGVGTILEGSVRSAGDRIRVTAQLVDAQSGFHLWSQSYDRDFKEIFKLQDELATAIVQALQGAMNPTVSGSAIQSAPTQDVEAYQLYLQARSAILGTEQSYRQSIALYDQAIARDPRFARALAGRARTRMGATVRGYPLPNALEDAERDVARALATNPNLAEAHMALGSINSLRGHWLKAEASFQAALSMDSNDPQIRFLYVQFVLSPTGRLHQALSEAGEAYRLAPADLNAVLGLSIANSLSGRDVDAVKFADLAVQLGVPPSIVPLPEIYSHAAARSGQYAEAAARAVDSLSSAIRSGGGAEVMNIVFSALAEPTKMPAARDVLQSLVHKIGFRQIASATRMDFIIAFTRLDALDQAYDLANRSLDDFARTGLGGIIWSPLWMPDMRPFRQDARFQDVVTRLGLMEYWKQYGPPDECGLTDGKLVCR
jgi:adenylate cyclase